MRCESRAGERLYRCLPSSFGTGGSLDAAAGAGVRLESERPVFARLREARGCPRRQKWPGHFCTSEAGARTAALPASSILPTCCEMAVPRPTTSEKRAVIWVVLLECVIDERRGYRWPHRLRRASKGATSSRKPARHAQPAALQRVPHGGEQANDLVSRRLGPDHSRSVRSGFPTLLDGWSRVESGLLGRILLRSLAHPGRKPVPSPRQSEGAADVTGACRRVGSGPSALCRWAAEMRAAPALAPS